MSNLQIIEQQIKSPAIMNRLAIALGYESATASNKAKADARRYAASVLAEVQKSAGDKNKDLTMCTPDSIAQAMIDAAKFKLEIDGRQHAHLVKYGNKATLQLGYRGFLHKLSEVYLGVDITAECIFKGDVLEIKDKDGYQSYTLTRAKTFPVNSDFEGVFVAIKYTHQGRDYQKVTIMSKADIDQVKSCAKQDYIWKKWYFEKAKVACIKRACKFHFANVTGLQEAIRYDNESHFTLTDGEFEKSESDNVIANLNKKIAKSEPIDEVIDNGPEVVADDVIDGEVVEEEKTDVKYFIRTKDGITEYNDPDAWASDMLDLIKSVDVDKLDVFEKVNGEYIEQVEADHPALSNRVWDEIASKRMGVEVF